MDVTRDRSASLAARSVVAIASVDDDGDEGRVTRSPLSSSSADSSDEALCVAAWSLVALSLALLLTADTCIIKFEDTWQLHVGIPT